MRGSLEDMLTIFAYRVGSRNMKIPLVICSLLLFANICHADNKLCVSSAKESIKRDFFMPPNKPFDFAVQVDDGPIIKTKRESGFVYPVKNGKDKHLVKVYNEGKVESSFKFSFSQYGANELCMWFKPYYETWSLWKLKDSRHLCDCK